MTWRIAGRYVIGIGQFPGKLEIHIGQPVERGRILFGVPHHPFAAVAEAAAIGENDTAAVARIFIVCSGVDSIGDVVDGIRDGFYSQIASRYCPIPRLFARFQWQVAP